MSGLAEILLNLGYRVSGSDLAPSEITDRLESLGLTFHEGHLAANLGDADIVVVSAAVPESNPELVEAHARGVPVMHRSELLADIIRMKPHAVVVGGTHGKTTTTSMISAILDYANIGATSIVGGILQRRGTNALWGTGEYVVAEADEHDGSFLRLHPTIAVVTNIDAEHLEYYGTIHQLQRAFVDFCNGVPFYGMAVLCGDDANTMAMVPDLTTNYITYGFDVECGVRADAVRVVTFDGAESGGYATEFEVLCTDDRLGPAGELGTVGIAALGANNVRNALAACAVGLALGISFDAIATGIGEFGGVRRRMQWCGTERDVTVIEDYAHHPTEIAATLQAARQAWPHLYSRTKYLYKEFANVLSMVDEAIVTDIYGSREDPIPGVSAALIVEAASRPLHFVRDMQSVPGFLIPRLHAGDVVLILGAGNINKIAGPLLEALRGTP